LKLSVYGFNDLVGSFGILQFDEDEIGRFYDILLKTGIDSVRGICSKVFGEDLRSISFARGKLIYRDRIIEMIYLRFEVEDNRMYIFEVYRESAFVYANTDAKQLYADVVAFIKEFLKDVKLPRTLFIGF